MAITDNSFTPQEFQAAIEANPTLLSHVTPVLTAKEFIVRDKAAEANYLLEHENKKIGEYTSKIATEVEKSVEELTGIKKIDANEKWTAYYNRATKAAVDRANSLDAKVKEFEKTTDISAAERQRLTNYESKETQWAEEKTRLTKEKSDAVIMAKTEVKIYNDITPVKARFKSEIPKEAIAAMENNVISGMMSSMVVDDKGNMFFKDAEGKAILNAQGKFATAADVYEKAMDSCIDKGKKLTGAGGDVITIDNVPAGVTNKIELSNYLNKKGLIAGTKEFTAEYNKYQHLLPSR